MGKKAKAKQKHLVVNHLEGISSKIFDKYHKEITRLLEGHYGIYALYKNQKLYYIGKASNFKTRIKSHLKDKHAQKWNKFSLYILRAEHHIQEIEALMLRIADPRGNRQKGKLTGSKNLQRNLKKRLKESSLNEIENIFGTAPKKKRAKRTKTSGKRKAAKGKKPLQGFLNEYQRIYSTYKGTDYKAKVLPNGIIERIPDKTRYRTPTAAAKAIVERGTVNGWTFWKYKDKEGKLKPLKTLKEKER